MKKRHCDYWPCLGCRDATETGRRHRKCGYGVWLRDQAACKANKRKEHEHVGAEKYVIKKVSDFLKVPANRQADCLAAFAVFLGFSRGWWAAGRIGRIGPFVWIDDGKKHWTKKIHAPNSEARRPAVAGTLPPLVDGSVFLAYYHTGFTEDPPELLDVCDSEASASAVIRTHKRNRDRGYEYEENGESAATWWTETRPIRTANAHADGSRVSDTVRRDVGPGGQP